jgi:hypothetical protein
VIRLPQDLRVRIGQPRPELVDHGGGGREVTLGLAQASLRGFQLGGEDPGCIQLAFELAYPPLAIVKVSVQIRGHAISLRDACFKTRNEGTKVAAPCDLTAEFTQQRGSLPEPVA